MPFTTSPDPASGPAEPVLAVRADGRFHLERPFYWHPPEGAERLLEATDPDVRSDGGRRYVEIAPMTTDLASVPAVLWGLLSSYGRQTLPALLHDQRSKAARAMRDPDAAYAYRVRADRLFEAALRDVGVETFRRWSFWAGAVVGRYWEQRRGRGIVLGFLAFAISAAFYVVAGLLVVGRLTETTLGPVAALALVVAAVLLLALVRPDSPWRFLLVALWLTVPVFGLLVVGYVVLVWTRWLPWAVHYAVWLATLRRTEPPGPLPPLKPTVLVPGPP